jgi:oligopeptide transport system substrate-binding protein
LEYIFKHDLTREAAYNGLLKRDRRAYHRQVAEVLESLFPERLEEQVGLLAHHWERAGVANKAVDCLQRAGDQARLAYSHEEAVDYYQRALRFLEEGENHEQAARTFMKLGLTYHTAFQFKRSRQAYEEGFAQWQRAALVQPAGLLPPSSRPLKLYIQIDVIDPAMCTNVDEGLVIGHLFASLIDLSLEMDVVPDVAQSWEVRERGREYTFHLRDDVRWSDGARLTAGDFEYAWKRILDPAGGSPNACYLYDIKGAQAYHQGDLSDAAQVGVRAVDESTLIVELEGSRGYFLYLLASNCTCPVPQHAVERYGEAWTEVANIVTNGPFRLQEWRRGESMVLLRNSGYHGRFTGNVQRVEVCLRDLGMPARLKMYEAGDLDVLNIIWLSAAEVKRVRQQYAGEYLMLPNLATGFLGFNVREPPFDDVRVRQALALASDRETLVNVALTGSHVPASGGLVPPGMPGHSSDIAWAYDPERARQILAEAGYPGGIGFPTVSGEVLYWMDAISRCLQAQWREVLGVETLWESVDYSDVCTALSGGQEVPDVYVSGLVADYPDPDNFLRLGSPLEETGWQNEAYDGLLEQARRIEDQETRMKLYAQAEKTLVEEAAILPLFYARMQRLVKPWVRRFPASATRWAFWQDIIIEPH